MIQQRLETTAGFKCCDYQRTRPSFEIRVSMSYAFISRNSFVIFSSGGGPHASTRVIRPAIHANRSGSRSQRCDPNADA